MMYLLSKTIKMWEVGQHFPLRIQSQCSGLPDAPWVRNKECSTIIKWKLDKKLTLYRRFQKLLYYFIMLFNNMIIWSSFIHQILFYKQKDSTSKLFQMRLCNRSKHNPVLKRCILIIQFKLVTIVVPGFLYR